MRIKVAQPVLSLDVRGEVRQVHVVITVGQQRIANRIERSGLVAAEVIRKDQIQSAARVSGSCS